MKDISKAVVLLFSVFLGHCVMIDKCCCWETNVVSVWVQEWILRHVWSVLVVILSAGKEACCVNTSEKVNFCTICPKCFSSKLLTWQRHLDCTMKAFVYVITWTTSSILPKRFLLWIILPLCEGWQTADSWVIFRTSKIKPHAGTRPVRPFACCPVDLHVSLCTAVYL